MPEQAITWTRDELILVLYLYMERKEKSSLEKQLRQKERLDFRRGYKKHELYTIQVASSDYVLKGNQQAFQFSSEPIVFSEPEPVIQDGFYPDASNMVADIFALCTTLNKFGEHIGRPSDAIRTPNSVSQKLCYFLSIDPDPKYSNWGIQSDARDVQSVWDEFKGKRNHLGHIAGVITSGLRAVVPPAVTLKEDNEEGLEGELLLRLHVFRERNPKLVEKKKQAFKQFGILRCEVCDFVFSQKYGPLGDGFIECHHTIPISTLPENSVTKLKDLALVCSNCHRMLHRRGEVLSITGLRSIVLAIRNKGKTSS